MKKQIKFTKRLSKRYKKNILRKRLVHQIKKKFNSNYTYEIQSPYNSNDFLINNQSSPFYDENEEGDFDFQPNEFANFDLFINGKDLISYKIESTNDESDIEENPQKRKNNEII